MNLIIMKPNLDLVARIKNSAILPQNIKDFLAGNLNSFSKIQIDGIVEMLNNEVNDLKKTDDLFLKKRIFLLKQIEKLLFEYFNNWKKIILRKIAILKRKKQASKM